MKVDEISDWWLDMLTQTTLFEMAASRRDAIAAVRGVANPIVYHLIYLYLYPSSSARNHWQNELNAFLSDIDELYLKPTGKRKLSGSDYYKVLFQDPLEGDIIQLSKKVDRAIRKEGPPQAATELYSLKETLEKILHGVSYDLANDKFNDIRDYIGKQ